MDKKLLCTAVLLMILVLLQRNVESKKVVIHVPYRVKNVKHTHTIIKVVPHHHHHHHDDHDHNHSDEDDKYEFYRKR